MLKKLLFILIPVFGFSQVGIGTTTPDASSLLEINATNKGILIPRVALTGTSDSTTISAPQTSLLVYNTSTVSDVTPGFYYWNGTLWVRFTTQYNATSNAWTTIGNSGINEGTNFLGTTDANSLIYKTNNIERSRILSNGHVLINTTTNDATHGADNIFEVQTTTADDDAVTGIATAGSGYGVHGVSFNGGGGVVGENNSTGSGVYGENTSTGAGVNGENSSSGIGVYGNNTGTGFGVYANAPGYIASFGYTNSGWEGVRGRNDGTGAGVLGINQNAAANGPGIGLYGRVTSTTSVGYGVFGYSSSPSSSSVYGYNDSTGFGVLGNTTGSTKSSYTSGVFGYIVQSTAGNQDVSGVLGFMSNIRQGTGGYAGPTMNSTNSALSGLAGSFASRETVATNDSYFFGVIGDIGFDSGVAGAVIPDRTGGVFGSNGQGSWGVVGYRNSAGTQYSIYGAGSTSSIAAGNTGKNGSEPNNEVGVGINGGFWGGYIQGKQYGLLTRGEEFGMYVEGNTLVNKPIVYLENNNEAKRDKTYMSTSTTVDITTRGKAKMINGAVFVPFDSKFSNRIVDNLDEMTITVTPLGASNGVYISEISKEGFYIKENLNGTNTVLVNWTAISVRKGYENGVDLSDELLSNQFEKNINGVMKSDADTLNEANPIYYDGESVRFERLPEQYAKYKSMSAPKEPKEIEMKEENKVEISSPKKKKKETPKNKK